MPSLATSRNAEWYPWWVYSGVVADGVICGTPAL